MSLFSPSSYNLFPVWISVRAIFHLFIRLLVHVLLEQGSRNPDLGLSISFFYSVKPEEILKEDLLMEFLTPRFWKIVQALFFEQKFRSCCLENDSVIEYRYNESGFGFRNWSKFQATKFSKSSKLLTVIPNNFEWRWQFASIIGPLKYPFYPTVEKRTLFLTFISNSVLFFC